MTSTVTDGQPTARPSDPDAGVLLTPGEAAALFLVTPQTVAAWAAAGRLDPVRTPGGHRRYRAEEVRSLLLDEAAAERDVLRSRLLLARTALIRVRQGAEPTDAERDLAAADLVLAGAGLQAEDAQILAAAAIARMRRASVGEATSATQDTESGEQ